MNSSIVLKKMFDVTKGIEEIYFSLVKLEACDKKDSEIYKKSVNILKYLKNMEKDLYAEIASDEALVQEYLDTLLNGNHSSLINDLLMIQDNNRNGLVKKRIINRLESILNGSKITEDQDILDIQFNYSNGLEKNVENDILKTILRILNDYINDLLYQDIMDILLTFKYNIAFLYEEIEDDFLENNFEIGDFLCWQAKMIADANPMGENMYFAFKENNGGDILTEELDYLIELMVNKENIPNVNGLAILAQIVIRASLLFVTKDSADKFSKYLLNEIEVINHEDDDIESIIRDAISFYKSDLNLPNVVSFQRN